MLEQSIEQDIKTALLSGDKDTATTLRGLKSTILYAKVAANKRDAGLTDEEILPLLAKEAKKRQESADLYIQGGSQERADAELREKALIEKYLPKQLSEEEIGKLIDEAISTSDTGGAAAMGQVIGQVKGKAGASADGGLIAKLVKERLGL